MEAQTAEVRRSRCSGLVVAVRSRARGLPTGEHGRPVKTCNRCGVNVAGQRRYRDRQGYWCVACAKADRAAHRASHLPCDDCGGDIRRGTEFIIEDYRLCPVCHQKRLVAGIRRDEREAARAHIRWLRLQQFRRLRQWCMLAVFAITALAVLYWVKAPPRHTAGEVYTATLVADESPLEN
jgi:hypothetical protein